MVPTVITAWPHNPPRRRITFTQSGHPPSGSWRVGFRSQLPGRYSSFSMRAGPDSMSSSVDTLRVFTHFASVAASTRLLHSADVAIRRSATTHFLFITSISRMNSPTIADSYSTQPSRHLYGGLVCGGNHSARTPSLLRNCKEFVRVTPREFARRWSSQTSQLASAGDRHAGSVVAVGVDARLDLGR